jgi:nitrogen fixation protein NifB
MSATSCPNSASPAGGHPCFSAQHSHNARIHLPVAPGCNIKCGFCERRFDCANENRPGVTSRVLSPEQALQRVTSLLAHPQVGGALKVVGIAGPGDPLANANTFETFRLVREAYPHLQLCLSTNGLLLAEKLPALQAIGVGSITVTMNALTPATGAKVYQWVKLGGTLLRGADAAAALIDAQLGGIAAATGAGLLVKINSVHIPGVNDHETLPLAETARRLGARMMNILPLIPQGIFKHHPVPNAVQMESIRSQAERILAQSRHCQQCRADAAGVLGLDLATAELDVTPVAPPRMCR